MEVIMTKQEFIKAIKNELRSNGHADILKRMDKWDWEDCVQDVNFWIAYCGMTFEGACNLFVKQYPSFNPEVDYE